LAKEVTLLVRDINEAGSYGFNIAEYVVTEPMESVFMGREVVSEEMFIESLERNKQANVVIAIGTPSVRQRIVNRLNDYDIRYPCLVHPSSKLNSSVNIKEGVIICSNVIFTVDITIGKHTYINFGCSIAHDVKIGDFVQINPFACISGKVKIGDNSVVGAGSVIYGGIKIGAGCTIGIGSVVLQDLKENTTVFGNPARKLPLKM